uniref:Uncharacterized protein n=1 Tax=Timema monikensis TaxID=170555 RepID=A0A7R9HMH9_9NEOP|nr:unnamed protein product [Timema monikensis]
MRETSSIVCLVVMLVLLVASMFPFTENDNIIHQDPWDPPRWRNRLADDRNIGVRTPAGSTEGGFSHSPSTQTRGCGFVGFNMATIKQDIADVYLTPPPRLGQWESCKLFLYDPSEGRVFGRTGASWGQ